MTKKEHNFDLNGPSFLKSVEWGNHEHKRVICASLIKGVYILEHERQHRLRVRKKTMAPSWWESFNFKVKKELVDPRDSSYYGVVYEFNDSNCTDSDVSHKPPRYVIAFRGTKLRRSNIIQDVKLNISFSFNILQKRKRVKHAIRATREAFAEAGPHGQVWLAGHSLGSSIALITGQHMVEELEANMETFLFNPPMVSLPMENLTNSETKKLVLRMLKGISTHMAHKCAVRAGKIPKEAPDKLSSWTPYLFLNPRDPISAEYIGHFSHLSKTGWLTGNIEAKHSFRCLISTALGKEGRAYHLIPSANLIINSSESRMTEAHAIRQWWRPNLNLESKLYKYDQASEKFDLLE